VSSGITVSDGAVTVELDRAHDVLLMQCIHHRTQEAVRLSRSEVGTRMVDFFARHEDCRDDSVTLTIVR
jgi:hypothetical protein